MKRTKVTGHFEVSVAPDDGRSVFKQTIFRRSVYTPPIPSGGSFENPCPYEEGWFDGIPEGDDTLWATTRIFTSDGLPPHQWSWATPQPMADTSSFMVRYSASKTPSGNPDQSPAEWTSVGSTNSKWMATKAKENGIWNEWVVTKIVGENAEYYSLEADITSITRTATGYSPYLIRMSEYHHNGSLKDVSNEYYIHVIGVKNDSYYQLARVSNVNNYVFNASAYYDNDYDCFVFELRKTSSWDSDLVSSISVSISREGSRGYSGARMRMREWSSSESYLSGSEGEEWYDVVEFNGHLYLCIKSHDATTTTPDTDIILHNGNWEIAQEWTFVATKLLLSEQIKSSMIDTDDLIAKRIYTDTEPDKIDEETGEVIKRQAHIEMSGSEMRIFGSGGQMNIRFGVNESGMAVLEYYDNNGRKLYDLGPTGIAYLDVEEESWTEAYYQMLGSSISQVLNNKGYKEKIFSESFKVYQYHSQEVEGVIQDAANDELWFVEKDKTNAKLPDGVYRKMPTSYSGNNIFFSYPCTGTGRILTSEDLIDLSEYNEVVYDRNPLYSEPLYIVQNGRMTRSLYSAYWNVSRGNLQTPINE